MTTSIHQSIQASVIDQGPYVGTETKTITLMIVAKPIGNILMTKDWDEVSNNAHKKAFVREVSEH